MKIEKHNTNPSFIQKQLKSVEKQALKEISKQTKDSVSISPTAEMLLKLKNHPDVRLEKIRAAKQLIKEEQAISKERVRIGIKKMLLEMFSQQTL